MKPSKTAKTLIIVAAFALGMAAGSTAKAARRNCSNATLKGTYADQDTGTIVGLGPFAGVNVDTFDGKGHMTISGISSLNGSVSPGVETGTYKVMPDCTGTLTVEGGGLTIDEFFVIDRNGDEVKTVITDPGNVIDCVLEKQFPEHRDFPELHDSD